MSFNSSNEELLNNYKVLSYVFMTDYEVRKVLIDEIFFDRVF